MGNYGMKVSKPGYDVKTATDDQLVFSSEFNQFKIKSTGTSTSSSDVTVAHSLSYIPIFFGMSSIDGVKYKMEQGGVDSTNVLLNTKGSTTYWRYYILFHQAI